MSNLTFAMAYAQIGWAIFPVWSSDGQGHCRCPKGKDCQSPGKHPHSLAQHGHLDATTDTETIKRWFESDPHAGVGVSCERSGLVVVDIDPRNGGTETLAKLESEHGPLISNCMASTQGGGEHRVFKANPRHAYPQSLGAGIDLKYRGYICVEPSRGPSGHYHWREGRSPLMGIAPSELPAHIDALCGPAKLPKSSAAYPIATAQTFVDLRDALTYVNADDYQTWIEVGLALKPYGEIGYDIWSAWSAKSNKFNAKTQRHKWDRDLSKPRSITYRSIFDMARKGGWPGSTASSTKALPVWQDNEPEPENLFESYEPGGFDPDSCLPPLLADWVKTHAAASGIDAIGYAIACLPVMSAATTREVRINLGHGHVVPVIIWAAIVGKTGSGKSPVMNAAHKPVSAMNAEEVRRAHAEKRQWEQIPRRERQTPEPTVRHIRYAGDTTIEALTANLARSDGPRLLLHYDEGSAWLNSMGRYSSSGDVERATYLSSWLGLQDYHMSRIGRGELLIPELGVSILFGITPNKIKEGLKEAAAEGLLARPLLCVINRRSEIPVNQPSADSLSAVDAQYAQLIRTLSRVQGCELVFSPHAQSRFDTLRNDYGEQSVVLEGTLPALAAVLAKAAENVGRLAGLFRLCRPPEKPSGGYAIRPHWTIETQDLALADQLMAVALDHAQSAYTGVLMTDEPTVVARECALKILRLQHDRHTLREAHRDQFMKIAAFRTADRVTQAAAIDLLRTYHWLTEDTTQRARYGSGRFSDGTRWQVNPKALDGRFKTYAVESTLMAKAALNALLSLRRRDR